jgi:hypothetical protein
LDPLDHKAKEVQVDPLGLRDPKVKEVMKVIQD